MEEILDQMEVKMTHAIQPLRAERFLKAALEYMEPFKGSYIYDAIVRDYREKTDQVNVRIWAMA